MPLIFAKDAMFMLMVLKLMETVPPKEAVLLGNCVRLMVHALIPVGFEYLPPKIRILDNYHVINTATVIKSIFLFFQVRINDMKRSRNKTFRY